MTEQQYFDALAEFTAQGASALDMDDDLAELGVDSIGVFEFMMKIEDLLGRAPAIDDGVVTVQDLYERVLDVAAQRA